MLTHSNYRCQTVDSSDDWNVGMKSVLLDLCMRACVFVCVNLCLCGLGGLCFFSLGTVIDERNCHFLK